MDDEKKFGLTCKNYFNVSFGRRVPSRKESIILKSQWFDVVLGEALKSVDQ